MKSIIENDMANGADSFTPERIAELRKKIDYSDIPEIKDSSVGHLKNWKPAKKQMSFRIDIDNLEWLKSCGNSGYQIRLNKVLRWAKAHNCPIASL